jgi:hypothetical protein
MEDKNALNRKEEEEGICRRNEQSKRNGGYRKYGRIETYVRCNLCLLLSFRVSQFIIWAFTSRP